LYSNPEPASRTVVSGTRNTGSIGSPGPTTRSTKEEPYTVLPGQFQCLIFGPKIRR
jgi:hypothetical protein